MTHTTRQGMFPIRFKAHRCQKCGRELPVGSMAYRVNSRVYCPACAGAPDRDSSPQSRRAPRRPIRNAVPDYSPSSGPMPGKNAAMRCADGIWRHEYASVTEAVRNALDDYAQNDSTRKYLRGRLDYALSGRDGWAHDFTKDRFLRELSDPSAELLEAVDRMRERLLGDVAAPSMPRRRIRRGQEFGEEIDSDRFLARSLTPWDRNVREQQARRTVTIGCNLSVNCHVKPH